MDFTGVRPPQPSDSFDSVQGFEWASRLTAFVQKSAKLDQPQEFTARNTFKQGQVSTGPIMLTSQYSSVVDIQKVSRGAVDGRLGGGNSALYLQHSIDSSVPPLGTASIGIRSQVQTYQQRNGTNLNDAVAFYGGIFNGGTDVGGFGFHIDAYNAGAGANSTMYGFSAEMYNVTGIGFTVGFHARSIDSAGYSHNDYGFLASPSPGGVKKFKSVFAAGSSVTGTMICDYGLDLRFSNAGFAAIALNTDGQIWFDPNGLRIMRGNTAGGILEYFVSSSKVFGIEDSGRLQFNTSQFAGASGGVTAKWLIVSDSAGAVWKIHLDLF